MKVTEYFVGFGPRLWSFRRGETEYGIKALPLGGYVKIPGMTNLEEVDPADEGRLYREQALPHPAAGGRGRFGHALPHGLRAAVGLFAFVGVPNPSQVQIQGFNPVGAATAARPRRPGCGPATWWSRSTAQPSRATWTS